MACRVSVIVRADREGSWLIDLVSSLDAQTLAYDEFEALFVVTASSPQWTDRLTELSKRRPNLRVVDQPDDDSAVLQRAAGTWVIDLGGSLDVRQPRLFPRALQSLADFGDAHGCDVVLGRVIVRNDWSVNDLFIADRPRLERVPLVTGGPQPAVLRRRAAALGGSGTELPVGALASYPSLLVASEPVPNELGGVQLDEHGIDWQEGAVLVTASGSVSGGRNTGTVVFGVRDVSSGIEYWLPGEGECADGSFSGSARIDLRDETVRERLVAGRWLISVGVHGDDADRSPRAPLPASSGRPGIVDGLLIGRTSQSGHACLDIGAQSSSVVGRLDPAAVTIDESARGTTLVAKLDSVHAVGAARVPGRVLLGNFALHADLVVEDGRARLECLLSGFAGSSELRTDFGSAHPAPTGLTLVISPVGEMTVRRSPPKPARKPTGAVPPVEPPVVVRLIRRLRRTALAPAVNALARNPRAVRIGRRLARGSRAGG